VIHRKRLIFSVLAAVCIFLLVISTYFIWGNIFDPLDGGRAPVPGRFVGQRKETMEATYGRPTSEWAGHFGAPDASYAELHSPAISTTYERLSGTLYLSYEQRQGEWVCFDSFWCPNGWTVD